VSELVEPEPPPPGQDWRDHSLCQVCSDYGLCLRPAWIKIEDTPTCEHHFELLWDRWQVPHDFAALLPPLLLVGEPFPAPRVGWHSTQWGSPELDELRAQWRRFQGAQERPVAADEGHRCQAVLSAVYMTRCELPAADGFLCANHAARGCLVPGLGWRAGAPVGNLVKHAAVTPR